MKKLISFLFTTFFTSFLLAVTINTTPEKTVSGTWTPAFSATISAPTVGYSVQVGEYIKRGPLVMLKGRITVSSISGGSGNITITGLPFTTRNATNVFGTGTVVFRENFATAAPEVLRATPNSSIITALSAFAGTGMTTITVANVLSNSDMIFDFNYFTDQ